MNHGRGWDRIDGWWSKTTAGFEGSEPWSASEKILWKKSRVTNSSPHGCLLTTPTLS